MVQQVYLIINNFSLFIAFESNKDIIKAKISQKNATAGLKPEGYYRMMYFDRFGRDDQIKILFQNYLNTQNVHYFDKLLKVLI